MPAHLACLLQIVVSVERAEYFVAVDGGVEEVERMIHAKVELAQQ